MSYSETSQGTFGATVSEADPFSIIDQYSSFDGNFVAERDLRIDGEVKGTIQCNGTLFVARGAVVEARVEAENIAIAGNLTGEIRCSGRLQLLPSGRLSGKVTTTSLVISDGAVYEGDLTMEESVTPPMNDSVSDLGPDRDTRVSQETDSSAEEATAIEVDPLFAERVEDTVPSTFIRRRGGPETPWQEEIEKSGSGPISADEEQ